MKKLFIAASLGIGIVGTSLSSCSVMNSTGILSSVGLNILQNVLLKGINQGVGLFNHPKGFLSNALIESVMPKELQQLNRGLEAMGMGSLVEKEKQYLGEIAGFVARKAQPILIDAVKNMTAADAASIITGKPGAATDYLRRVAEQRLISAMTPTIDQKLNEYPAIRSLNARLSTAGGLGSLLGGLLGSTATPQTTQGPLSHLVAEYMTKGLFKVIENYERGNLRLPAKEANAGVPRP